jgi:hypothetical protein
MCLRVYFGSLHSFICWFVFMLVFHCFNYHGFVGGI